jgi:Flp pilus assembly protein TadD
MKTKLLIASMILATQIFAPVYGADEFNKAPAPGYEWTAVEDLNPNARATNRPIRQKWAVIVGLSKFKEKRLDNSLGMDAAAHDFYTYAVDPNAGRFQKDHVRLLVNSEATEQTIMSALGKPWLGSLAGPDDLAVVFVSTLGFPTTDGSSYLCSYDCALDNVYGTCISIQNLMGTLRKNVGTDRILLVLQACYSGAAELNAGAKALMPSYNLDPEKVMLGKGYVILSSSQPDQMTWGSDFSRNLIEALRDKDGLISVQNAFEKAKAGTEHDTAKSNQGRGLQTPVIKSDWSGKDLVLGVPPIDKVATIPPGVINYLSAESHYLKANQSVMAGDLDTAKNEYKSALATDPNYADALGDYGALLCMKGDWQGACDSYQKAINLRPDDFLFHTNYARVLSKLGKDDQSQQELEQAYKLNPKDRVVLSALSTRCLETQDFARANTLLDQAITLYPKSASLHDRLSYVKAQSGDLDGAIAESRKAIELDPSLVSAYLNLGASLLLKDDAAGATETYRKAEAISPKNADIHYCLSRSLEKTGDRDGAGKELNLFIDLTSPNDPRLASEQQHLSELRSHQ